jgi:hypothetical protein
MEEIDRCRDSHEAEVSREEPDQMAKQTFSPAEPRSLRDDLPWRDLFPGLPTVEAARQEEDPVFWAKADEFYGEYVEGGEQKAVESFFLAGYSVDGLRPPLKGPRGASLNILSVGQFLRRYDRRFYGLMISPPDGTMHWKEISDRCLEYEGPGYLEVCLDESWEPKRYSEVLKDYPACRLPPSIDAFQETKFKDLDTDEFKRMLVEGYRRKVLMTNLGTVRERYRLGEIREIVCVAPGELFLDAVAVAAWSASVGEDYRLVTAAPSVSLATNRGLEPTITASDHVRHMARKGVFVLLHDRKQWESLPSEWKCKCFLLNALEGNGPCEAIFEGPICYIKFLDVTDAD